MLLNEYDRAEICLAIAHELAHLKRRDLLWAWLPVAARVLFFFHPAVWLAQREWRMAHEMDCDASVLLTTGISVMDYGRMLIKVATGKSGSPGGDLLTVGVVESHQTLRRRLISMQYVQARSRRRFAGAALVLTGLGIGALVPWRLVTTVAHGQELSNHTPKQVETLRQSAGLTPVTGSFGSNGSLLVPAHGQGTAPSRSVKAATPQPAAEHQYRAGSFTLTAESEKDGVLRNVVVYARSGNSKHFVPGIIVFSESAHMLSKARGQWVLKNAVIHSYNVATGAQKSESRVKQLILKTD
jgi:hypothetical protein